MELMVTGRHLQITDAMKRYAKEKAGKLPHFYDRIETTSLILDHESQTFKVEIVARADHRHVFVAHADGADFFAAFDVALEKLERQLSKHKERFRNRKHISAGDEAELPETER